jgi:hypothetical protein
MVNHQPTKYEALSSNPTTTLKEKKKECTMSWEKKSKLNLKQTDDRK